MKYRVEASQESGSTQAWELSRLNCLCWDTGTLKMQTKMLETKSCWDTGTSKMQTILDTGTLKL